MTTTDRKMTQNKIPQLPDEVWTGFLSNFSEWVKQSTDGATEGIFAIGAQQLGQCIGRNVAVHYGRPIYPNFYVALIGQTGVPRKTTLISRGHDIRQEVFPNDFVRVVRSIGSGEGLLEVFCDEEFDPVTKKCR